MERSSFKNLIKPFKKILDFFKNSIFVINPDRNWATFVYVFIILAILIAISKFFVFYKISSDDFILVDGGNEEINVLTIDRGSLEDVLNKFKLKSDKLEILKTNPPSIGNP